MNLDKSALVDYFAPVERQKKIKEVDVWIIGIP